MLKYSNVLYATEAQAGQYPVEVIMNGLKEDAAQHGTSLAALVSMLVDEGAEASHGGSQVLIQLEVCRDLDSHLISLQDHNKMPAAACKVARTCRLPKVANYSNMPKCS